MNPISPVLEVSAWSTPAETAVRPPVAGVSVVTSRRQKQRAYRRRLGLALLCSVGFHTAALLAFNARSTEPKAAAAPPADDAFAELNLAAPPEPPPVREESVVREENTPEPQRFQAALPEPLASVNTVDVTMAITPFVPVPPQPKVPDWTIPLAQERDNTPRFSGDHIFKIGELDRKPEIVLQTAPTYPVQLATDNINGVVIVQFVVNAQGAIVEPTVVSAPHPLLGDAVVRCVRQWKFRAGMKNGRAVSTEMQLPVRFNPNT